MKKLMKAVVILISAFILAGCAGTEKAADFEPFYRFDAGSPITWSEPLRNVRFLTKGAFALKPLSKENYVKYELNPDTVPDKKGMDTLNISGSAQFSENQFRALAEQLRVFAKGKDIYVIDCRIEDHALLNGISISWYGDHNWANMGEG